MFGLVLFANLLTLTQNILKSISNCDWKFELKRQDKYLCVNWNMGVISTFFSGLINLTFPERSLNMFNRHSKLLTVFITAPFNNMRTLKFKLQQMRFSLPSIRCSAALLYFRLCCLKGAERFDLITARSAEVESWEKPPNIWLTVAKNAFVGWALNVKVRMLLKGAVTLFSAFKKQPRSLGFFHDGGIYVLPLEVSAFLEKSWQWDQSWKSN